MDLVNIRKNDPLKRNVEKGDHEEGLSPMTPPSAYAPPGEGLDVSYDDMHPFLQALRDEHETYVGELGAFEAALGMLQEQGPHEQVDKALQRFFSFVKREVVPHNRREEQLLFPLLAQRLRESGEHSKGPEKTTAIDVLEADHVHFIEMSAVVLNFFGIFGHLPDERSQRYVLATAIEQAKTLVEDLRLHIFREDNVVFSLAHRLISAEDFDQMVATAQARESDPDHHGHGHDHDHDHHHS